MYTTCFDLIKLLPKDKAFDGHTQLADRLLGDLTMEARRPKQTVVLQSLLQLINIMKTDFVQHTRRFIRVVSILLLGPLTPGYLRKSLPEDARDETIHLLVLRCVLLFVQLAWLIAATAILPDLFSPLIAFVELEYSRSSKYASEGTPDEPPRAPDRNQYSACTSPCVIVTYFCTLLDLCLLFRFQYTHVVASLRPSLLRHPTCANMCFVCRVVPVLPISISANFRTGVYRDCILVNVEYR
ncbi:hypothetical protein CRM22_003806 [Opisthorchis felineus]|uniref:Uncharacterized protein n=1 Tax=Opisthorchis felineus TaxID=147828 RepID=A0A4V3SFP8_OPIFE|nr:hypothetical protein CRM22_003806 [Opisthorchis felineus]